MRRGSGRMPAMVRRNPTTNLPMPRLRTLSMPRPRTYRKRSPMTTLRISTEPRRHGSWREAVSTCVSSAGIPVVRSAKTTFGTSAGIAAARYPITMSATFAGEAAGRFRTTTSGSSAGEAAGRSQTGTSGIFVGVRVERSPIQGFETTAGAPAARSKASARPNASSEYETAVAGGGPGRYYPKPDDQTRRARLRSHGRLHGNPR